MIIKKRDRLVHANGKSCIAYEYPFGDEGINIALVEIDGRYPDAGRVANNEVKEMIWVVKGRGKVAIDGQEQELGPQDSILIRAGQRYFFEGRLTLVSSCNPAWKPEQHKLVE